MNFMRKVLILSLSKDEGMAYLATTLRQAQGEEYIL